MIDIKERLRTGMKSDDVISNLLYLTILCKEAADHIATLEQESAAKLQRALVAEKLHWELLFEVGNKYPGETRHETAIRYIKSVEARIGEGMANTSTQSTDQHNVSINGGNIDVSREVG